MKLCIDIFVSTNRALKLALYTYKRWPSANDSNWIRMKINIYVYTQLKKWRYKGNEYMDNENPLMRVIILFIYNDHSYIQ